MGIAARFRAVLAPVREREEGFTIIEILIAAFILVLASLAVFMTFAAAIKNVQRGRETQIGVSVAQREVERIRVIPFDAIKLQASTIEPETAPGEDDPLSRVLLVGGEPQFDVVRDPAKTSDYQPVLLEDSEPEDVPAEVELETPGVRSSDGTEVTVMRFVTCEEEDESGRCVAKRLIVDVLPTPKGNLGNYERRYYELQSTIVDPGTETEPEP